MHTYRVEVYDRGGALLLAARLRCHDDGHARERVATLPLPPGRVEVVRGGRRLPLGPTG